MKPKETVNMKSDRQYKDSMMIFYIVAIGIFGTLLIASIINLFLN